MRPVFATSWPAEALFEREEGLTQEGGEASYVGSSRSAEVTAACVLDEGESAAQELVKCVDDGISDWEQVVLSPRILARRSDGAVAVICSAADADPMACNDFTFGCGWDGPLFFLFPRCRDDTAESVIIELTVELCGSGRQQSVAHFTIDAMRNRPACEPAYLLCALERTVPWARCPPPSLHAAARRVPPPPPPPLDAASPAAASAAQTILSCVMARLDGTALAACACVYRAWRASAAAAGDASLRLFPSLFSATALPPRGATRAASLAAARRAVARASRHVLRWQAQRDHFGAASEWALADFTLSIEAWWAFESVGGEGHDESPQASPQAASLNDAAARPVFAASFPALRLADSSTTDVPCELAAGESALADLCADAATRGDTGDARRIDCCLLLRVMARRVNGAAAVLCREPEAWSQEVCVFDDGGRLTGFDWCCSDGPLFYVEEGRHETFAIDLCCDVRVSFAGKGGSPRARPVADLSLSGMTDRVSGLQITSRDLLWALEHAVPWS